MRQIKFPHKRGNLYQLLEAAILWRMITFSSVLAQTQLDEITVLSQPVLLFHTSVAYKTEIYLPLVCSKSHFHQAIGLWRLTLNILFVIRQGHIWHLEDKTRKTREHFMFLQNVGNTSSDCTLAEAWMSQLTSHCSFLSCDQSLYVSCVTQRINSMRALLHTCLCVFSVYNIKSTGLKSSFSLIDF